MSTDGSKIPAAWGIRNILSDQASSARRRAPVSEPKQTESLTYVKDAFLNSAEQRSVAKSVARYQNAADRAKQEQRREPKTQTADLERLRQRHGAFQPIQAEPALDTASVHPDALELLSRYGADALFRAHIDETASNEALAAKFDVAQQLTAASNVSTSSSRHGLAVAARAQRINAAQREIRSRSERDNLLAKLEIDDAERRQRYADAMAEEKALRKAHSDMVRDLLLERFTSDFSDYEPAFTGKPEDPLFLTEYPTETPLIAGGNLPKLTVGQSGVPHGQALKLPGLSLYDHETDQYTDEVKPTYLEGTPFEDKEIAGPLVLPSSTESSS